MGASHTPGTPLSASYVMCLHTLYASPPTTPLHSRGNLGGKAGRLVQGCQARKWHSAQETCLSCLLISHRAPLQPEGKRGGEGMLRVPEEVVGAREDRSWGICHSPGPPRGCPKGLPGDGGCSVAGVVKRQSPASRPLPSPTLSLPNEIWQLLKIAQRCIRRSARPSAGWHTAGGGHCGQTPVHTGPGVVSPTRCTGRHRAGDPGQLPSLCSLDLSKPGEARVALEPAWHVYQA